MRRAYRTFRLSGYCCSLVVYNIAVKEHHLGVTIGTGYCYSHLRSRDFYSLYVIFSSVYEKTLTELPCREWAYNYPRVFIC
jgi:hypothetical protein